MLGWRVVVSALVLGGWLLVSASEASAQRPGVTFTGTVRDYAGAPVVGATVTARGAVERGVVTDQTGTYRLGPLPAGTYEIRVRAIGFQGVAREVQGGEPTVLVPFVLETAPVTLAPVRVLAATRVGTNAASLPIKVEVIAEAEVQLQQSLVSNPTELLANLIPSFSPGRQKLTSSGESFRGRRPLFLVDGVPQSNPLRDGRRDGFTIDLEVIERVEVVFGANAVQGLGATGGIVNYVTVSPPSTGRLEQRVSVSTSGNDGLERDGLGWRAHYLAAKRFGEVDVLGSISYETRGLQFDGLNRRIAIDNVQGDVADSRSHNMFVKLGWEPSSEQRLQLTMNDFRLAQEGEFASVNGDRALGIPASSVPGNPEGVEPINDVTSVALDYEHIGLGGGALSAKLFVQDFAALFGGGRFGVFQDPQIEPVGELFDQSENNSEKVGSRLTYSLPGVAGAPADVVMGIDFLRDRTFQRLVRTNRNWVPVTEFSNQAPFLQVDLAARDWLSLSSGLRWEIAQLRVPNYTTLAGNRSDYQRLSVEGGRPSFDEPLFNLGAVVTPTTGLRFYGTFSQAYTMPDVGRVLRGVKTEGTRVDDFLDLVPIKTANREVGAAWGATRGQIGVTYFESDAELGSRLVPNADGIFQVRREPTQTRGWELSSRIAPAPGVSLSAGYSLLEGSFDGDGDGDPESDLGAADIGPDRLNLMLDLNGGGRISGRIQSFTFFDETFRDANGAPTATFDGYSTVDSSIAADLGRTRLVLSIANLLDAQYITYFGQAATNRDDRYFAGRGRTLTLRAEARF